MTYPSLLCKWVGRGIQTFLKVLIKFRVGLKLSKQTAINASACFPANSFRLDLSPTPTFRDNRRAIGPTITCPRYSLRMWLILFKTL